MSEMFTELFDVEYEGKLPDLLQGISRLDGVNRVSSNVDKYVIVDEKISCEIMYDSELTDRTEIVLAIEEIDGVKKAIKG